MTPEQKKERWAAFVIFKEEVQRIWRNADQVINRCALHPDWHQGVEHAALVVHSEGSKIHRNRAIGSAVIYLYPKYSLKLAPRFFAEAADEQRRILIHEACHIGYGGHGKDFREFCRKMGGVVSGAGVGEGSGKVVIEVKVGARFKPVVTVNSEAEATAWYTQRMVEYRRINPNRSVAAPRYRMTFK